MEQTVQNHVRLIACPSLALEHGRIDRYVPEGATVAEHLRAIGWQPETLHARVSIDGVWIAQAQWEYAVPRAGQSFVTRVIPMGGGGGNKDALRIVAMLAVVVAAIALPYSAPFIAAGFGAGTFGGALAVATTSIIGSLAITAIIPPARPGLCDQRQVLHV